MEKEIDIPELAKTEFSKCIDEGLIKLYNIDMKPYFENFIFCSEKPSSFSTIKVDKTFPLIRLNLSDLTTYINLALQADRMDDLITINYDGEENDLIAYIKSNSSLYSKLEDIFNKAKDEYLSSISRRREKERNNGINGAHDLLELDDSVGDTTECDKGFTVDIGSRDAAFVYLEGKILIGNASDTHSAIITKYFNEPISDYNLRGDEAIDVTGDDKVGFGHIADGIAFIETCDNVSPEEIEKALKETGDYKKIYSMPLYGHEVTRLAKIKNNIIAESNQSFYKIIRVNDSYSKFINIFKTVFCSQDVLKHISEEHMIQFTSPFSIIEEFSNEYSQKLLDAFNKEFNSNLSDIDDIDDIVNYMKDHEQLFDEEWNKATYNYSVDVLHDSINELKDKDDSIGDEVNFPRDAATIDVGTRDSAFVYINGEILVGNDKQTHGQLINEFFNCDEDEDSFYREDAINKLNDNDKNSSFGFGHIIDSIAIIDNTDGCTMQEVANALLNYDSSISKVYFCPDESTLTRVAKNETKQ